MQTVEKHRWKVGSDWTFKKIKVFCDIEDFKQRNWEIVYFNDELGWKLEWTESSTALKPNKKYGFFPVGETFEEFEVDEVC
jgi:hypothetical protein